CSIPAGATRTPSVATVTGDTAGRTISPSCWTRGCRTPSRSAESNGRPSAPSRAPPSLTREPPGIGAVMAERLWSTRSYVPADVDGILGLRRVVFGDLDRVRLRPEIWRWQFIDNPAGAGWVRLAVHDDTIVGQYAAIPTRFRLNAGAGEE